ncbi:MAG: hypothetical protein WC655_09480 [Candidatus Hydrogenedentales bacterium]|jgi:hypothetical protein
MTEQDQSKILWDIADQLRAALNEEDFRNINQFSLSPWGERYFRAEVFRRHE